MTPRPAMTAWVEWECGFGFDQVEGDASDAGAGDCEGEESEGGALGGEGRGEAEDWVSVIHRTSGRRLTILEPSLSAYVTTKKLKEWLFQNSLDDQWWISVDGVTNNSPQTLHEIEALLDSEYHTRCEVLHSSQSTLSNPPWIEVEIDHFDTIIGSMSGEVKNASSRNFSNKQEVKRCGQPPKNPGVAAVLSFFIPGLGQIYNGQIAIGIITLFMTIVLYFVFPLGIFLHLFVVYDAYSYALKFNKENTSTV